MKTIEEFENQMLNDENEINTLKENLKAKDIEINKDYVYKFLKKFPTSINVQDIKNVAEYLSKNYQYFSKVKKEQGISKLEFITKICRLEFAKKGSTIIEFGDTGEKFYVVMEEIVKYITKILKLIK